MRCDGDFRNSKRIKIILFRNVLFAFIISIVPALLPVVALKEMQFSAAQLGVVYVRGFWVTGRGYLCIAIS